MKHPFFKRLSALLLALLLLASLASCKPGEGSESSDAASAETTEAPQKELVLFSDGTFNFTVTRPDKVDDVGIYTYLHKNLRTLSEIDDVNIDTDAVYNGHEYDPEKLEILCGYTDFPESEKAVEGLGFTEYKVTLDGNKVVIAARSPIALEDAVLDFLDYVEENMKDGALTLPSDFLITGKALNNLYPLLMKYSPAVKTFKTVDFSDCGDDFEQATLTKATKESFLEYKKSLEDAGFKKHAENDMAGNLFATYTKDNITIHTYFIEYSSEMRIVASKDAPLPSTEEVSYTKTAEPSFTLLGLEKGGSAGGLGCIIGLEDGSFIIIDGGHNTNAEGKDIADTLMKLSPTKDVTIRAWVISHGHSDHYGAFVNFSKQYGSKGTFTVESFVFNFCDAKEQHQYSSSGSFSSTLNAISTFWKDATVYKGLTGQVYRYAGCDMEIMYCMSDFLPNVIGEEAGVSDIDQNQVDGNLQTMVVRFITAGQKILVTGDTSKFNVDEMCDRYGEYLASEIMTVPHHGYNQNRYRARNGTMEFYKLIDPAIVMWPDGVQAQANKMKWDGNSGSNWEANYYLLHFLNVKECHVAGSTTKTFNLPYNGK